MEYVIMDGGSNDSSLDSIRKYEHRLKHWQSGRDGGQAHAIEHGFRHTSGDIMAWINSDDVLCPGAFRFVSDYFTNDPDVDVIYSHRLYIDPNDFVIRKWILPGHIDRILIAYCVIPQETAFWRRRSWEDVGGIDTSFRFAMDYDLWCRMMLAGARFRRINRFFGAFRTHPKQKTITQMNDVGVKEINLIKSKYMEKMSAGFIVNKYSYMIRKIVYSRVLSYYRYPNSLRGAGWNLDEIWDGRLHQTGDL